LILWTETKEGGDLTPGIWKRGSLGWVPLTEKDFGGSGNCPGWRRLRYLIGGGNGVPIKKPKKRDTGVLPSQWEMVRDKKS